MQVSSCEWFERPDGESFVLLFGLTGEGASAAVVVRGVHPTVEALVPKQHTEEFMKELKSALPKKAKIVGYEHDGSALLINLKTTGDAKSVEFLCMRPVDNGEWRLPKHLVAACGSEESVRLRCRADPVKRTMEKATVQLGAWIRIPPRQPGMPLVTSCTHEGVTNLRDLSELKMPAPEEHAPFRVLSIRRADTGSIEVAADAGTVDEDVFNGPPAKAGADLGAYVVRVDPDIIVVYSLAEFASIVDALPSHARAWGRIRGSAQVTGAKCSGRVLVEARERFGAYGDVTARGMLTLAFKKASELFIRTRNRPSLLPPPDALRPMRFRIEQEAKRRRIAEASSMYEALDRAKTTECEMWTDPTNGTEHPIITWKGKRIFVV